MRTERNYIALAVVFVGILLFPPVNGSAEERPSAGEQNAVLKADLVTANHILSNQGIITTFGHVSVRSAANPNHFFLAAARSAGIVTGADILEYDLDGKAINDGGRHGYIERFIHSEIYRARPDVQAIVHAHTTSAIAFSVSGIPLRAVFIDGAFINQGAPVFEIRNVAGADSNMLIDTEERGAALARALGTSSIVLMRGHGDAVVAQSLKVAVERAIYAEENAHIQLDAMSLGREVVYLNPQETQRMLATEQATSERPWEVWKAMAEGQKP